MKFAYILVITLLAYETLNVDAGYGRSRRLGNIRRRFRGRGLGLGIGGLGLGGLGGIGIGVRGFGMGIGGMGMGGMGMGGMGMGMGGIGMGGMGLGMGMGGMGGMGMGIPPPPPPPPAPYAPAQAPYAKAPYAKAPYVKAPYVKAPQQMAYGKRSIEQIKDSNSTIVNCEIDIEEKVSKLECDRVEHKIECELEKKLDWNGNLENNLIFDILERNTTVEQPFLFFHTNSTDSTKKFIFTIYHNETSTSQGFHIKDSSCWKQFRDLVHNDKVKVSMELSF